MHTCKFAGVQARTWASLIHSATYLKPRKRTCSHSHASSSKMTIVGKAKPNQEAKFTTLEFSGKSLPGTWDIALVTDQPHLPPRENADTHIPLLSCPRLCHSRVHLALQHQVGCGTSQCGDAPNAGRVADAQAHALGETDLLLVLLCPQL